MIWMVVGLVIRRRWPVILSLVILYITSVPLVGMTMMKRLESHYHFTDLSNVPPSDAIVVLGGVLGPLPSPQQLVNLNEANERLEASIQLMLQNKGKWLVFTGGRIPWVKQEKSEGEYLREIAIERGVSSDKVLVTEEVGHTQDEARVIAEWMRNRRWKQVTLITSAWHMPRAARLFRHTGVNFLPVTVDYQIGKEQTFTLLDFLPSSYGLRLTETVIREWYGIFYYTFRGKA
jgi:uncharacterized SAM-binding protein YcdF (DUF218 family)